MIDLVACSSTAELAAVDAALTDLARYDDILFASSNAARFFFQHVRRSGRTDQLRGIGARILCIGAKTAESALAGGLPAHFVLAGGRGDADSMLGEIVRSLSPTGRRVLIPRSDIGRDVLPEGLREAGARVDAVTFYRNVQPEIDEVALRRDLVEDRFAILTFTSPSAVERFAAVLDDAPRAAAARCIIAAIGATTARALGDADLPVHVVPKRPDVREMVALLAAHVADRRVQRAVGRLATDRTTEEDRS
jgi:uroporphyrinogen III methyltransferase/synthase